MSELKAGRRLGMTFASRGAMRKPRSVQVPVPVDYEGRQIGVSDIIVYPGRHTSSLFLTKARVVRTLVSSTGAVSLLVDPISSTRGLQPGQPSRDVIVRVLSRVLIVAKGE